MAVVVELAGDEDIDGPRLAGGALVKPRGLDGSRMPTSDVATRPSGSWESVVAACSKRADLAVRPSGMGCGEGGAGQQ